MKQKLFGENPKNFKSFLWQLSLHILKMSQTQKLSIVNKT
jgi:hypothetical protein